MVNSLISSLRGTLDGTGPDWAEIQVGGVTFKVNVPSSAVSNLGRLGEQVRLYTSLQVREDNLSLFGFPTEDARRTFELLIGVNGVGPRVALAVLSRFSPDALAASVRAGDIDSFMGVPGVGKKTASRILLELKGKLEGEWIVEGAGSAESDAVDALVALGYTASDARQALSTVVDRDNVSIEDQVRLALQFIAEPRPRS